MEFNSDDLYQVALLIDQLKHEDSQLRIHAINSLPRIGKFKHIIDIVSTE